MNEINSINFKGGFYIKNPTKVKWNNIRKTIPGSKVVFEDINGKGDEFFAIKDFYDKKMSLILSKKKVNFDFYPKLNLKCGLDPYYPDEAKKIIDEQTDVITKKKDMWTFFRLRNSSKKTTNPKKLVKYKWKQGDYIDQTYKALGFDKTEYSYTTKDRVTTIFNKQGKKVALVSPNDHQGVNYVFMFPKNSDDSPVKIAVDKNGEILTSSTSFMDTPLFKKNFFQAVRIDAGRTPKASGLK